MSITVNVDNDNNTVEITVVGSFDFSLFNEFRTTYADYVGQYENFVIDMQMVEYLDSAALGMLLSMRNALGSEVNIDIANPNDFIRNILMISRFDKRFNIR
ncbi:STAS domain-containing protein [Marinomonas mediterranea]|jgi:Anti-anti-sigma regulatory factor (antagonist of anti-sigma factor)|uniref:Sulfate transporter/antisigma-factor antagonist STAS n=1 Tax=Marinomonas mediterranea (strain ATCC 700492 / JCM 21426 / NBRC 103028 / MMB-1) TaxID=717774 RepID=F2K4L1_MARM1|nr:STAS domain-containing protein [Marinomonas mediterranea]ADZ91404.1 Sulfate transporter/antisigma-factor antagonist STAS [Marinomonas mediterranea MMB-1]WCN09375.1 STAS domain-containing protein [Marinomonas mediterranea]WCN13452.1 STAS domain-containing protein [Marinomonas mediterranea]WCN17518.1 STAS domain-containing protein [Marinomonas mediterranea MMB-1]